MRKSPDMAWMVVKIKAARLLLRLLQGALYSLPRDLHLTGHDRGLAVDVIVQTDPMPAMPDPYVTLCFSGDRS